MTPTLRNITVNYSELPNSPRFSGSDGEQATRRLRCSWSDRFTLYSQLLGGVVGNQIYLPHPLPGRSSLNAREATIEPWGDMLATLQDEREAEYDSAVLTVTYRADQDDQPDDPVNQLSETLDGWSEFVSITGPDGQLYWDDQHTQSVGPDATAGKLVLGAEYVVTNFHVKAIKREVATFTGKTNVSAVRANLLGITFDAETLLYQPPSLTRTTDSDGVKDWKVTKKFSYREAGWNKLWRPDTGTFEPVYTVGSTTPVKLYETADFSKL